MSGAAPALLASVRSAAEARVALAAPVDVLDLKEPARGALGALDMPLVREIVALAGGRRPLSATVGDLPADAAAAVARAAELEAAGVDFVKLGFFSPAHFETLPAALRAAPKRARRIAVLFADRCADFAGPCRLLAAAGFDGVMIDTADKTAGSVRALADDARLADFVRTARGLSLLCGIAGALGEDDIAPLAACGPDYLGFRTALCAQGRRDGALCAARIDAVARRLRAARAATGARADAPRPAARAAAPS